ncbi:TPA: hypothetical protein H5563_005464, partial [Escherichia coli]|nr:hypothetical protein [Escherichia coli]
DKFITTDYLQQCPGGIIFEVKHGGYQPVAADDYAHWAPAEGEPGTTELMAWYAQAQVGDSTFAV